MFILNSPRQMNTNIFFMVFIFFKLLSTFYFLAKKNIDRFYSCEFHGWFLLEYNDGTRVKPGYVTQEIFCIAYSYKNVKFIVEILS